MNVILRNSTRRMIDQSRAPIEAESFITWLRAEGYTDYVIDCHIRRLFFVLPKLSPGTAPPMHTVGDEGEGCERPTPIFAMLGVPFAIDGPRTGPVERSLKKNASLVRSI